jgi:hypothetical protein
MFIYLVSVLILSSTVKKMTLDAVFKKGFAIFIVLSSPFVVKLIMLCLTEWLVVTLFIWITYSFLCNRVVVTVALLALLPFLRQNMLFVSLFLFAFIFFKQRISWRHGILYVAILLLPLYHNLYYAGEWKFLATYSGVENVFWLDFDGSGTARVIKTFFYHILLYGGIDWLLDNPLANLLAISCIPIGTLLYLYCINKTSLEERRWFMLITLSAIIPTLITGGRAYYPRFEWVNLYFAALIFIVIKCQSQFKAMSNEIDLVPKFDT